MKELFLGDLVGELNPSRIIILSRKTGVQKK